MTKDVAQTYDDLTDHYHLIFEDWERSMERQAQSLSSILHGICGLPATARVLDCACGIGTQSLGLAKLGYQITGCDLSSRSIQRAQREAEGRKLSIPFSVANMLDLSSLPPTHFDAVICMDNALPHLDSQEQLVAAATQMRSTLRSGGHVIGSVRDYDALLAQKPVVQGPWFYIDDGRRRIVFQVWDWIDDRRYTFHLYITREIPTGWQTIHASGAYHAWRRSELNAALSQAGFNDARWLEPAESGFYQPIFVAQRH